MDFDVCRSVSLQGIIGGGQIIPTPVSPSLNLPGVAHDNVNISESSTVFEISVHHNVYFRV